MTEPQIDSETIEAGANALASGSFVAGDVFDIAHCVLTAAAPRLRRQWEAELRAKIASEIETFAWSPSPDSPVSRALREAARIARGAQPGGPL
jgi:hypothetical protein